MSLLDLIPGGSSASSAIANTPWNPANAIPNGQQALNTLANNFILKPATFAGINGFLFSVSAETTAAADTDITDHYTEYNTFFQDHAALRPIEITMRGYTGEQVVSSPSGVTGVLSTLQSKLTQLPALLGKYTPQALSKVSAVVTTTQNFVNQVDNVVGRVQNLAGLILGSAGPASAQVKAFRQLMAMRDSRCVFNLNTPWGYVATLDPTTSKQKPRSFVIKRLVFEQPEETEDKTDIIVTLKEVRFATVASTGNGQTAQEALQNTQGVQQQQAQGQTNKGTTSGLSTPVSSLFSSFGHVTGSALGTQ